MVAPSQAAAPSPVARTTVKPKKKKIAAPSSSEDSIELMDVDASAEAPKPRPKQTKAKSKGKEEPKEKKGLKEKKPKDPNAPKRAASALASAPITPRMRPEECDQPTQEEDHQAHHAAQRPRLLQQAPGGSLDVAFAPSGDFVRAATLQPSLTATAHPTERPAALRSPPPPSRRRDGLDDPAA